jgi:hypothetical protein
LFDEFQIATANSISHWLILNLQTINLRKLKPTEIAKVYYLLHLVASRCAEVLANFVAVGNHASEAYMLLWVGFIV